MLWVGSPSVSQPLLQHYRKMNCSVSIAWSNKHLLYSWIHGSNAVVSFPVSISWVPGKGGSSWPRETLPIIRVYSVMSSSLQPYGLCSPPGCSVHGDSPGQNTGLACHFLLQKIYPTQGLNPHLLHCRWILYHCAIQEMQEGKSSSSNTFKVPVLHLLTSHWPE